MFKVFQNFLRFLIRNLYKLYVRNYIRIRDLIDF